MGQIGLMRFLLHVKIICVLFLFINFSVRPQDINNGIDESYHDFGLSGGLTIFAERSPIETFVLNQINGPPSDRKTFIETEFLEEAGFRRTGNVKYRKTETSEKVSSVLHGIGHLLSFGIIPMKPFSEIDYDRLPRGVYNNFESVFVKSKFNNVSLEVQTIMKLEYMLQIEFCNGVMAEDSIHYYTDENINNFEKLTLTLPDYPENIKQAKDRFLIELEKIKAALERHKNPSENQLRAIENLKGGFIFNER